MLKDRAQKQLALRFAVANRWFPQLEVDVHPERALSARAPLVTDLDVLASIPDQFRGYRSVVFDCKTRSHESPVNRALWLAGVLERMESDQGFCILRKDTIELDHRLFANRINVILLSEDEFELYARSTCRGFSGDLGHVSDITKWEALTGITQRYPKLEGALKFIRSTFWMSDDSAEACRKVLAELKAIQPELDPSKPEHVALFLEFCSLFGQSLAVVVCQIFRAYLHPANQGTLSDALLVLLYGGREAYEHRNELFRLIRNKTPETTPSKLSLPEWEKFIQLVRQCLDAPLELARTPLILREVGFSLLAGDKARAFAAVLCSESSQGARFATLIPAYLARATRLPPDFAREADEAILPLIRVK